MSGERKLHQEKARRVGAILQARLLQLGWQQQDLAEKAQVPHSTVSRAVRGICLPETDNLERMALALGLPLSYVLDQATAPMPEVNEMVREISLIVSHLPEDAQRYLLVSARALLAQQQKERAPEENAKETTGSCPS
ncbi:MAG: helix-turn-helix transcriptional regulator [Chloroflexi bacterium]|nr:helix-turn-helix transcriptional regulator [Chloroflexota bacterium]